MAENPLHYKDFIKPDSSLSDLIAQLEEVLKVYERLFKKVKDEAAAIDKSMRSASGATEEGRRAIDEAAKAAEALAREQKKLTAAQSEAGKELARLRLEQQKANAENKLTAKLNQAAEGSYNALSAQYSLNQKRLNAMSEAQRENTEEGRRLTAETKALRVEMKRLQEATDNHTLSVGDYEKGWRGMLKRMQETPGAAGDAAKGFDGMSDAAKAFLANPLALTITLIVGGLAALFSLFKKTESGAGAMAKAQGVLNGIMSFAVGLVDSLYKAMVSAWEDPLGALKDLGQAILDNLVNRLKAAFLLAQAAGKAILALADGDMAALEQAGKDAASALIQMQTGLDEQQQRDFAQALDDTTQKLKEQGDAFDALEGRRRQVRKENRLLAKALEDVITQQELQQAIADDATKSFAKREAAQKSADAALIRRAKLEQDIAKANLGLVNAEIDLRKANNESVEDLLDEQLSAYQSLKQAQRDYLLSVRDNQKRESELVQDRLERDLDILLDAFDTEKNNNLKRVADATKTEEERRALLDETGRLADKSFAKQIETIQQFTGIAVDSNSLINESDATVLNQKIRSLGLSEIIEGRLLEIVRDRKDLIQELADAEKKLDGERAAADAKREAQAAKDAEAEKRRLSEEAKARYDAGVEAAQQEKDLRLSEIDLMQETEAEKTRLRLEAEKARLLAVLKLNETAEKRLSDLQIQTMQNTISSIDKELSKVSEDKDRDLYSAFGIELSADKKKAVAEAVGLIAQAVKDLLQLRIDAIDRALDKLEEEREGIDMRYQSEIEAREAGLANNALQAQRELELNAAKEAELLKQKQKAQKAQNAIDTATQISSLITASAQIWASLSGIPVVGPILAGAAIAAMFTSFAVSKVRAKQAAQAAEEFGDGGMEILQGGSHASGNDIPIGTTADGRRRTAEGGEAMIILNRKSTRQYRGMLPHLVDALNAGKFDAHFGNSTALIAPAPSGDKVDTRRMEGHLATLVGQNRQSEYRDARGRRVVVIGNRRRIYNN